MKNFTVGGGPNGAAYDPVNHDLYVAESDADKAQVFSPANKLVGTVKLPSGSFPGAVAFDPEDNLIYVTGELSNAVYAVGGTSLTGTITDSSFDEPAAIAYDPPVGDMIVTNFLGNTVSWVAGLEVLIWFPAGNEPDGIAYDPFTSSMIVTDYGSNSVTCLSATGGGATGTVAVGTHPSGVAYDPAVLSDFVANTGSNKVSVLTGCEEAPGTISGFDKPLGVGFSQSELEIYVTNSGNGKVNTIIDATIVSTYKTASKSYAASATYDDYNNDVYVSGFFDSTMYVVP